MSNEQKNYDLEERTAKFGENTLIFCKTLKFSTVTEPLIKQVVRSSTSVGANYLEANGACSRKDFQNKIFLCKKEAQESRHWFRMLAVCLQDEKERLMELSQEAKELAMIFNKISATCKINND